MNSLFLIISLLMTKFPSLPSLSPQDFVYTREVCGTFLIEVTSTYCGPCKIYEGTMHKITQLKPSLTVRKFNIAETCVFDAPCVEQLFYIQLVNKVMELDRFEGIPMTLLIVDGQIVATQLGAVSEIELFSLISKHRL